MSNQYNLRRRRNSSENISLPLQVQLSDVAFMSEILGSSHPPSAQPDQPDQMSDNDQNLSDIVDHSGTDNEIEVADNAEQVDLDNEDQTASAGSGVSIQDIINKKF